MSEQILCLPFVQTPAPDPQSGSVRGRRQVEPKAGERWKGACHCEEVLATDEVIPRFDSASKGIVPISKIADPVRYGAASLRLLAMTFLSNARPTVDRRTLLSNGRYRAHANTTCTCHGDGERFHLEFVLLFKTAC